MIKRIFLAGVILAGLLVSCDKEEEENLSGASHNAGRNCMSCHKDFKIAGTVYNKAMTAPYPGAKIRITTQANGAGDVLALLTSDKSGNFFTGSSVNIASGVYVSVEGTTGYTENKSSKLASGACNSCHGASVDKIRAE